jgi:hypothetical protein
LLFHVIRQHGELETDDVLFATGDEMDVYYRLDHANEEGGRGG